MNEDGGAEEGIEAGVERAAGEGGDAEGDEAEGEEAVEGPVVGAVGRVTVTERGGIVYCDDLVLDELEFAS